LRDVARALPVQPARATAHNTACGTAHDTAHDTAQRARRADCGL